MVMLDNKPLILAILTVGFLLFLLAPVMIAYFRRHPERRTIARLSVGGLFSFILWGALVAWAASDKRDDAVISKYVARLRERNLFPLVVGGLIVAGLVGGAVMMLAGS